MANNLRQLGLSVPMVVLTGEKIDIFCNDSISMTSIHKIFTIPYMKYIYGYTYLHTQTIYNGTSLPSLKRYTITFWYYHKRGGNAIRLYQQGNASVAFVSMSYSKARIR